MFKLLSKIFIKDSNLSDEKTRSHYGILCTLLTIFLNILLFTIKFIIGLISNSVSITADAFNNLSDSASSIISFIAFKFSLKPPDKEHPMGHGRYEYIASFIISISIISVGFIFSKSSLEKIVFNEPTVINNQILIILIISIFIKIWIGVLNLNVSKKINSKALKATSIDAFYDVLITSFICISLFVSNFLNITIDGYTGIIISIFIIISGIKLIKETLNPLLGEAPSKEFVETLTNKILNYDKILGVHDLIVHNYGPNRTIASIHAEVPANMNLIDVHIIIDKIEKDIQKEMNIHLVIHIDPIDILDIESNKMIFNIKKLIKDTFNQDLEIIDFRILRYEDKKVVYFEIKTFINDYYLNTDTINKCINLIKSNFKEYDFQIFKNNTYKL